MVDRLQPQTRLVIELLLMLSIRLWYLRFRW